MFLPQPSVVLTVFTGLNTSLPIHTTVVVKQLDAVLDFSLDSSSGWVVDFINIDKAKGEIRLKDGWEDNVWKNEINHRTNSKGKMDNYYKITGTENEYPIFTELDILY